MSVSTDTSLGALLESISQELDISPSKYEEAVSRYRAVGEWLDAEGSALAPYRPRIYPQGSFRLGTVVRPVRGGKEADYDIDLVCHVNIKKATVSPRQLKHMIGDRLKEHGKYEKMLDDEGRRCWTLEYAEADGIGFHLDALPAIPEDDTGRMTLAAAGAPEQYAAHAIAITERLGNGNYVWVPGGSNPFGYAQWFDDLNAGARIRVAPLQKRMIVEAHRRIYASVDAVPEALVRTPLQRAIQILKRHRDVRFSGHEWESEKPISMIITTLAALAYDGQMDIASALDAILTNIDDYATSGIIRKHNGKWVIPNPVNPGENFADRWNEPGGHRAEAFFEWVAWVQQDLSLAREKAFEADTRTVLAEALGLSDAPRPSGSVIPITAEGVPALASTNHRQPPPWQMQSTYKVTVTGDVRRSRDASKSLWRLARRPVPKSYGIRFRAETNAPAPYEVKWQIVNTGAEAVAAGREQLRGGFEDGEGALGTVKRESTAYLGTHTIEAFVIKDGVCVARSGALPVRVK